MAPTATTPLLADSRRLSEQSDRRAEEEDAALHNTELPSAQPSHPSRAREVLLFFWALLATATAIVLAVYLQHRSDAPSSPPGREHANGKRNLVFMVSDGMGPAPLSLTRSFRQFTEGLPIDDTLTLDRHFWGTSRTRSSNKLVTDSAAGATAFSCGKKSYNGAISMLPDFTPCGTVLEAAHRAGYKTGLVVTTDVTDATPACFASHVYLREQEDEIALQEIGDGVLGRTVDLILGGGRCHFLPNTTERSCRADDMDVAAIAQEKYGWSYADDRAGFDRFQGGNNISLPALGLFAHHDIPFEVDRRNMADIYPSLSEMATTALKALSDATKNSDQGFFLMIEGSRIDHAGHANDPAAQVREVLEFDKTFKAVLDFIEGSSVETVLVSTSDHETGGLATAWQSHQAALPVYNWYPAVLARANASAEYVAYLLRQHLATAPPTTTESLKEWINSQLLVKHLGITDAYDRELEDLASNPANLTWHFSSLVSRRARIGWSTHGHSAVDVNIYSSGGYGAEKIRGNVENTQVGEYLREFLGVNPDKITKELNEKMDRKALSEEAKLKIEAGGDEESWITAQTMQEFGLTETPLYPAET